MQLPTGPRALITLKCWPHASIWQSRRIAAPKSITFAECNGRRPAAKRNSTWLFPLSHLHYFHFHFFFMFLTNSLDTHAVSTGRGIRPQGQRVIKSLNSYASPTALFCFFLLLWKSLALFNLPFAICLTVCGLIPARDIVNVARLFGFRFH